MIQSTEGMRICSMKVKGGGIIEFEGGRVRGSTAMQL